MPSFLIRTIALGTLCGGCLALLLGGLLLHPLTTILRTAQQTEIERLRDAFEEPLSAARRKGDDLAVIDELRRLRSLPGVLSAEMGTTLSIKLSATRWRRWNEQVWERLWAIAAGAALWGGVAGALIFQRQRRRFLRRHTLLTRRRGRRREQRRRLQAQTENQIMPWVQQALSFSSGGMILLDGKQRAVAFNQPAVNRYGLSSETLGKHWLEIQPDLEWAQALQRSLQTPGERVPGPSGAAILTSSPEATWIVLM